MSESLHIAYFITAHGRGHAVRCAQVIQALAGVGARVTVISDVPEAFLREQGSAPFEQIAGAFDCGTIHRPGDHSVDAVLTLDAYRAVQARNRREEGRWLRVLEALAPDVLLTDVAAFPLWLAHRMGVPGVILSNFTWYDIYKPLLDGLAGGDEALAQLRLEYSHAARVLVPPMNLPMDWLARQERVPLVARKGRNRAAEIRARLGLGVDKRLVLFYAGPVMLPPAFWAQVALNEDCAFLFYALPPGAPVLGNIHVLPSDCVHPADVVPSMDLVLAKAGYGIAGECMADGVPIVYAHRSDFLESSAISRELDAWGGAIALAPEVLLEGRALRPYLEAGFALESGVRPVRSDGAEVCAGLLTEAWTGGCGR
ncbi:MAG: hypothetical protein PHC78_02050 [Verrucomicrobiota bacterium]|jgi:UDP:flavonoid glycosyltransferase YjiC (YdhE family)|nr:hypothetical protein [Verrucomicrobiota bacterium]HCF96922.1 hypothetical protein [Verrucomicrobiota bacterium]